MKRKALVLLIVLCFLITGAMFPVYWVLTGNKQVLKARGNYSAIALKEMSGDPSAIPEYGIVYVKDDDTLMYIDGAGGSHDLTAGGGSSEWAMAGTILGNTDATATQIDFKRLGNTVISLKNINVPGSAVGNHFEWGGGVDPTATEVNTMLFWDGAGPDDVAVGAIDFGGYYNGLVLAAPVVAVYGAPGWLSAQGILAGTAAFTGTYQPSYFAVFGSLYDTGIDSLILNSTPVSGIFEARGNPIAGGFGLVGSCLGQGSGSPTGVLAWAQAPVIGPNANARGLFAISVAPNNQMNQAGLFWAANSGSGNARSIDSGGEMYHQGWIKSHIATGDAEPNFEITNYRTDQPVFEINDFRGTAGSQELIYLKNNTTPDVDYRVMLIDKTSDSYWGWDETLGAWDFSDGLAVDGTLIGGATTSPEVFFRDDFMTTCDSRWTVRDNNGGGNTWGPGTPAGDGGRYELMAATNGNYISYDWDDDCYINASHLPEIFVVFGATEARTVVRVGLMEADGGSDNSYIYLELNAYNPSDFYLHSSNAGTSTSQQGEHVGTGDIWAVRIWFSDATTINWWVAGVGNKTPITGSSYVPTVDLQPFLYAQSSSGNAYLYIYTFEVTQTINYDAP